MSDTIETANSLMETPEVGIISAGGPSSSELLNRLRDGAVTDVTELDRRTAEIQEQVAQLDSLLGYQLTHLAAAYTSLLSRLPSTSGHWLADFYVDDFVVDGVNGTTAEVNTTYGQVTLPILSTQEKLVGMDSRGEVWVPRTAAVHYAYQTAAPSESQWLTDPNYPRALDQRPDTAWWRRRPSAGYVWVRVQVPANLNANRLSNCIILHPFPVLSWDLYSVEYRNPGGNWSSVDLSWLEGWNGSKLPASWLGNLRLFFPQNQVVELRIKLYTDDLWGFSDLRLQQLEFSPSATLVVDFDDYNTGTLGEATVLGKDPDSLSYLGTSVSTTRVTVNLTQSTTNSTPVITAVEAVL